MDLVFVSNYLNQHQLPFCTYMNEHCDHFSFIATDTQNIWGYQKETDAAYVHVYSQENKFHIEQLILSADVVIFGSTPTELITLRMEYNRLSFFYSERFYKYGVWRRWNPRTFLKLYRKILKYRKSNMYVLCASAYLPYDLKLLGFPERKCFKWGYFPEKRTYDLEQLYVRKRRNKDVSILWVGRLTEWKHPDTAIALAAELKQEGYSFQLHMVGDGELKPELHNMIKKKNLADVVHLCGSKSHDRVRRYMEEADIFIFTSDRREGWGAVVNEAMNSACAVVTTHAAGCVPFLIRNDENGMIYEYGNKKQLFEKIRSLIDNAELRRRLGTCAYRTIVEQWNAESACEKFFTLCDDLCFQEEQKFGDHPCCRAKVIKDH